MNDLKGIIEDCNKSDLVSDKIIKKIIEIIGQEKWQDLHDENNDICTTMGELIITLKGISELEQKLEQTEKDLADYQFNYPTIKELSKENEKLDKQIDTMLEDCKRCTYRKTSEQLEQAKEIIEDFMITETGGIGYSELYDKAEQFLKEIEK